MAEAVEFLQREKADIVYGFVQVIEFEKDLEIVQVKYYPNERKQTNGKILSANEKNELYCHMFDLLGRNFRQGKSYVSRGPVARVLTKELAEKCPFDTELSLGEDAVWNLSLLKQDPHAGFIRSVWYLYCRKQDSASQIFDDNYKLKSTSMLAKLWALTTSEASQQACLRKAFEMTRTLALHYYLTLNFKDDGMVAANHDFNHLLSQYPWNNILKFANARKSGWKELIKFILIKTNLLLPAYAIKSKL